VARRSLEMLGNPNSEELMKIVATVGLAQNFGAIKSLVTTGIQKGHMKMHLSNVLNQLKATEQEFVLAVDHFSNKLVSHKAVQDFLEALRLNNSSIK
jgi:hydroxymethylglutaryl-CoA reductase